MRFQACEDGVDVKRAQLYSGCRARCLHINYHCCSMHTIRAVYQYGAAASIVVVCCEEVLMVVS